MNWLLVAAVASAACLSWLTGCGSAVDAPGFDGSPPEAAPVDAAADSLEPYDAGDDFTTCTVTCDSAPPTCAARCSGLSQLVDCHGTSLGNCPHTQRCVNVDGGARCVELPDATSD